jgi:hypothetical protein
MTTVTLWLVRIAVLAVLPLVLLAGATFAAAVYAVLAVSNGWHKLTCLQRRRGRPHAASV